MTDRIRHITITLERDVREDDAEVIIGALKMIKGVAIVTPRKVDAGDHLARMAVVSEVRSKLLDAVYEVFHQDPKDKS